MAITRDEAYAQYKDAYGSHFDNDAESDFQNYWNNAQESGAYQGSNYGSSWDQVLGQVKNRVNERFNQSTDYRTVDSQSAQGDALYGSGSGNGSNTPGGGGNPTANAWTASSQQTGPPDWYKGYLDKFMASQEQEKAENKARADQLFGMWMDRAKQPLVDRNNPAIRAQADANAANETRAQRNYMADLAENAGPLANLRGEQRMSAERLGQRTGGFEAELIGRELTQQRAEQADALRAMSGMLSGDQMREAQQRMGLLDQAIRERGLNLQAAGLGQDWQRALLQNQQFMADLGLRAEDRSSYWDALRRGMLG
jgi:hypothetical protein